jgi:hypothetical protein
MIRGIRYYKQTFLKKLLIELFGKTAKEKDEIFTFEGKTYKKIFYYKKQYQNKND